MYGTTEQYRDTLGRQVREAWVRWAQTQSNPKPSWLVPYDELDEADQEADRQIGEALVAFVGKQIECLQDTVEALRVELERLRAALGITTQEIGHRWAEEIRRLQRELDAERQLADHGKQAIDALETARLEIEQLRLENVKLLAEREYWRGGENGCTKYVQRMQKRCPVAVCPFGAVPSEVVERLREYGG